MSESRKGHRSDLPLPSRRDTILCHLQFGWWTLAFFSLLGIVLEALHGFKSDWYLNVMAENRRFLWTLAHGLGTTLGLVHLGFAISVWRMPAGKASSRLLASYSLMAATLFLPAGALLAGVFLRDGKPGMGLVLMVPGSLLLITTLICTAASRGDR